MVKKLSHVFLVFGFWLMLTQAAFAASFTASVDQNTVAAGESFTLQLVLSGASPKGSPDFSALSKDFTVYGTSQSSQTTIINGKFSSNIGWNVTLIPKKEGTFTIPSLSVQSDEGTLESQPIQITASTSPNTGSAAQNSAVYVDAKISKHTLYKNEPVLLTVRLVARKSISDVSISDLQIPGAIVEKKDDPKVYDSILNGQHVKVIEARYMITPLQDGAIKIPGVSFQGQIESQQRVRDPFFNQFGRGVDPFGMMDNLGFASYKPFAVAAQDITLDVKAPPVHMDPWLPSEGVTISDKLDGEDSAKVGEPLTRTLKITAQGLSGSALPGLESQIDPQEHFKVYADKPDTGTNEEADQSIEGWRKESYTLIPQSSGSLTLPEIKLAWWNTKTNKIDYASVPAKTINVKAGALPQQQSAPAFAPQASSEKNAPQPSMPVKKSSAPQPQQQDIRANNTAPSFPAYLTYIIFGLGAVVLIMAGLIAYLFRKLSLQKHGNQDETASAKSAPRPANEDNVKIGDLKKAGTAQALRSFVQTYAHQHWGLTRHASLQDISRYIKHHDEQIDVTALLDLDAALYANGTLNIDEAYKAGLSSLLKAVERENKNGAARSAAGKKSALNPS